jgi:hypothetical protein
LRSEALVAQHIGHEAREDIGNPFYTEALLSRSEGKAVAWQRGRYDSESIGRISAEARRVGEQGDDLVELEHRARPAVREQQRHRRRALTLLVNEVHIDAGQGHGELRERIELGLLRAPVEAPAPIVHQLAI